jgi:hypothetical protein
VRVTSRVTALAVVGLLVAAGAAFAIGRATAGESESSDPAGVRGIDVPAAVSDTPGLRAVGALPDLKEPPPSSSGGATAAPDSSPSEPAPSEPPTSTPPTSTPPTSEPPAPQPQPEPPPPPPPGEG